jgi:hypothetical protein
LAIAAQRGFVAKRYSDAQCAFPLCLSLRVVFTARSLRLDYGSCELLGTSADELGYAFDLRLGSSNSDCKLFPTDTSYDALGGFELLEQCGDSFNHLVSCGVSVSIVDTLEVIDVDHENSILFIQALTLVQKVIPLVKKGATAKKTREVVDACRSFDTPKDLKQLRVAFLKGGDFTVEV